MKYVKASQIPPEADPSERYDLKSLDQKSNVPLLFGFFAAGIVLYVKSVFAGHLSAQTEAASTKADDAGQGRERPVDRQWQVITSADYQSEDAAKGSPMANDVGGRSKLAAASSVPPISLADEMPLNFFNPSLRTNWNAFATSPVIPVPSNDNGAGPATAASAAAVRASVGGADGGSASNQPSKKKPATADDRDEDGNPDDPDSPNRAPRASGPTYLMNVVGSGTLVIALSDLLRNVEDPDGDALSVRQISVSSGTLSASGVDWVFSGGPAGPVTVRYLVSDGQYVVQQTAYFSVLPQTPSGEDEGDSDPGSDDTVDVPAGNDTTEGGAGDDRIVGGAGNDVIYGRAGNDVVFGGAGNDVVFGGAGNDFISGGDGDDQLFGEEGDDIIFGDEGEDVIEGGDGNDQLSGGADSDWIAGDAGDDLIDGGAGDDVLVDGDGSDVVTGAADNDMVVASLDRANDTFSGGPGYDTITYAEATRALTIDIADGKATGAEIGADSISGFEHVVAGSGDDVVHGGAGADAIEGGDGNDRLSGGAGSDRLAGDAGDDVIDGGAGDDVLVDGEGSDVVDGAADNDTVVASRDGVDDTFSGGLGYDTITYAEATEALTIDFKDGTATGVEIGEDSISGFENVVGGQNDDVFVVGNEAVTMTGGGGYNTFVFGQSDASNQTVLLHEIVDFKPGDLIKMSKGEIFEQVVDALDGELEQAYGDEINTGDAHIRYRRDEFGSKDKTVIEADLNDDGVYELAISLQGDHVLIFVDHG